MASQRHRELASDIGRPEQNAIRPIGLTRGGAVPSQQVKSVCPGARCCGGDQFESQRRSAPFPAGVFQHAAKLRQPGKPQQCGERNHAMCLARQVTLVERPGCTFPEHHLVDLNDEPLQSRHGPGSTHQLAGLVEHPACPLR